MNNQNVVESPCVSVCQLEPDSDICRGCLRTRDEIAMWGRASNAERLAIIEKLHERRAARGGRARRQTRRRS